MTEKEDNYFDLTDKYSELYGRYSDNEIVTILKKRSLYQPDAANAAIREAIKRGIIYSEQDLFSDKYKIQPHRVTLFPVPENDYGKEKLGKSILRIILIAGIIPIIQGVMKLRVHEITGAILLISSGLIWITLAWLLFKIKKSVVFYLLFLLFLGSVGYTINHFINLKYVRMMDVFVSGIALLIVIYLLFYLRKLQKFFA